MLVMRAVRAVQSVPLSVLARRTGISSSRLSLIERELATPTPEDRQSIAQCLQAKASVLFQPATPGTFVEHVAEDCGL